MIHNMDEKIRHYSLNRNDVNYAYFGLYIFESLQRLMGPDNCLQEWVAEPYQCHQVGPQC